MGSRFAIRTKGTNGVHGIGADDDNFCICIRETDAATMTNLNFQHSITSLAVGPHYCVDCVVLEHAKRSISIILSSHGVPRGAHKNTSWHVLFRSLIFLAKRMVPNCVVAMPECEYTTIYLIFTSLTCTAHRSRYEIRIVTAQPIHCEWTFIYIHVYKIAYNTK